MSAMQQSKKRSWPRSPLVWMATALVLLAGVSLTVFILASGSWGSAYGSITLEPDPATTVYTSPLRRDGTIDYIEAINRDFGADITSTENAFDGLFRLLPPGEFPELHERMRVALQIEPGELQDHARLVPWADFLNQNSDTETRGPDALQDAYWEQFVAPLISADWQQLAAWVRANADVLDRAEVALARPNYWAPLVDWPNGHGSLLETRQAHTDMHREMARAICARIKLALAEGDMEVLVRSFRALRRLTAHQSHEPFLIPGLVAMSFEAMAFDSLGQTLASGRCTPEALARLAEVWQPEDGRVPIVEAFRVGERCTAIDGMMQIAAGRVTLLGTMSGGNEETIFDPLLQSERFDINRSLEMIRSFLDRFIEIMEIEDYAIFWERMQALDIEIEAMSRRPIDALTSRVNGQRVLREDLSDTELTEQLTDFYLGVVMPALSAARRTEVRFVAKHHACYIAIACERYRMEHGALPESLVQLVPVYMDAVPADPIDGLAMRYRIDENGYTLYSIGTNQHDDGGLDDLAEGDTVFRVEWE